MFMFFMTYLIQSICSHPEVDRIWDVQRCFHSTHINVFYTLYVCIYIYNHPDVDKRNVIDLNCANIWNNSIYIYIYHIIYHNIYNMT